LKLCERVHALVDRHEVDSGLSEPRASWRGLGAATLARTFKFAALALALAAMVDGEKVLETKKLSRQISLGCSAKKEVRGW